MEAISSGATTMSRISDISGIVINNLGRYISELTDDHELIERKVPFDSKENNKMGRYYIGDNFLDFWFRYIFRNKSRIEILNKERIATDILDDMPVFTGKKFEKFMIAHLVEMNRAEQVRFDRIGQYWDRGETEIDIIFVIERDREINFGECKLSASRFRINSVEEKIKKFLAANRKYTTWKKILNLYTPGEEDLLFKSIPLE